MVICLERGADLHMAQLKPQPLNVSCFSKIQFGFAFLVPAHPGSPGQRAVKRVCVLEQLVRVQDWFHQHKRSVAPHFRPYVPGALPTKWYRAGRSDSMWTMWFIYYMHVEQVYAIYSNLNVYTGGKENCLCINRREPGLHNSRKGAENLCRLMSVWKDEYVRFPTNVVRLHWDGSPMGDRLY